MKNSNKKNRFVIGLLPIFPAITFTAMLLSSPEAFAATVYNNADGANNYISTSGNWDNGLPTGGSNPGTIGINAGYDSTVSHVDYEVLHSAGTISRANGFASFSLGAGTVWVMNGASAAISLTRGINLNDSQFTLDQGNADLSDNNRDTVVSNNAVLTINAGTMTIGRDLIINNGSDFTINGGTLTSIEQILTQGFASAAGSINFNGGTTDALNFQFDTANTVTFGGSTPGSLSLTSSLGNGATLDWLSGSLMELTIAGADQSFYEGLFASGDLLYEGSNVGLFGDYFQVSGATLSLYVAPIPVPEPSSFALLGLGGVALLLRRRRDWN